MATTYLHYKYENTIQVSKGSILVYEKCDKVMPFFQGNWRPTRSKPAVVKTFNCNEMSNEQSDLVVSSQERSEILQLFQEWTICGDVSKSCETIHRSLNLESRSVSESLRRLFTRTKSPQPSPQHLDVLQLAHVDPRLIYMIIILCWYEIATWQHNDEIKSLPSWASGCTGPQVGRGRSQRRSHSCSPVEYFLKTLRILWDHSWLVLKALNTGH